MNNKTTFGLSTILFSLPFLLIFSYGSAQNIGYNENLEASISELGEADFYYFGGNKGDKILIRMRDNGGPVDACIELLDYNDNSLTRHCRDGGIVSINGFNLPYTGEYKIRVIDNKHNDIGGYGLSLHKLNHPDYAKLINCGVDFLDTIFTTVGVNIYEIEVDSGEVAEIQMRSNEHHFESIFYLYDIQGTLIETSVRDKSQLTYIFHEFDKSGTYSLVVMDNGGNDKDYYGFSFQIVNRPDCASLITDCGTTQVNELTFIAEMDAFTFHAEEGKSYLFYLEAINNSFESQLTFYDPDGIKIQEEVVNGKSLFTILPSLTRSGDYQVIVRDEHGNDGSDYELSFSILDVGCCHIMEGCEAAIRAKLSFGTSMQLFAVKIDDAQPVTIVMEELTKSMEPMIYFMDQAGQVLDSDNNYKKAILKDMKLTSAAYHFIVALDKGGNDPGEFILSTQLGRTSSSFSGELICKDIEIEIGESGVVTITPEDVLMEVPSGCLVSNLSVYPNTFTCKEVGRNEVSVTMTDHNGNKQNCRTVVEIIGSLQVDISDCQFVFLDYAPGSCANLSAIATGGFGDYTYEWSHGETIEHVQVCPDTTTIYQISVTDQNGCKVKDEISVFAESIVCDQNGKKVELCHRPTGYPQNGQTLCISYNAIDAHLAGGVGHEGCTLGPCGIDPCSTDEEEVNLLEIRENGAISTFEDVHLHLSINRELIVYFGSKWMNTKTNILVVNKLGQRIWDDQIKIENSIWTSKPIAANTSGIYFVQVYNENLAQTIPVMIR